MSSFTLVDKLRIFWFFIEIAFKSFRRPQTASQIITDHLTMQASRSAPAVMTLVKHAANAHAASKFTSTETHVFTEI